MFADLLGAAELVLRQRLALGRVLGVRREGCAGAIIQPAGFRLALALASFPKRFFVTPDVDAISLQGLVNLPVKAPGDDVMAQCQLREA